MQRSKQQALMFLLGAVLVGGVLGYSTDRVVAKKDGRPLAQRTSFYDEFHVSPDQKRKLDSMFDDQNCKVEELMRPIRPALDSLKAQGHRDMLAAMTAGQRTAVAAREARMKARRDSIDKVRAAEQGYRPHRCGSRPGIGGSGASRSPGGPFFQ